jgi:hypothetical protein
MNIAWDGIEGTDGELPFKQWPSLEDRLLRAFQGQRQGHLAAVKAAVGACREGFVLRTTDAGLWGRIDGQPVFVPKDHYWLRLAPLEAELALTLVVELTESLACQLLVKLPFKGVPRRPFTYMLRRQDLQKDDKADKDKNSRPLTLYPLSPLDADPTRPNWRSERFRLLTGLAMLNYNLVQLMVESLHVSLSWERVNLAQPIRALMRCFSNDPITLAPLPLDYPSNDTTAATTGHSSQLDVLTRAPAFDSVLKATVHLWNEQTGEDLCPWDTNA